MKTFPLICLVLCSYILITDGFSKPRISFNFPSSKYTRPSSIQKQVPKNPQRRTFLTGLLAAEIAYLEGILAKQNSNQGKKRPKSIKPRPRPRPAKPQPISPTQPPSSQKSVPMLDPFYMIAAPDLSVKVTDSPANVVVKESVVTSSPPPMYGAYEEYKVESSTTLKYGDFELYQPKGYLPPGPPDNEVNSPLSTNSVFKPVISKPSKGHFPSIGKDLTKPNKIQSL